ncbi:MAG: hypothetical protein OIF32_03810 [Campylobacterales bacterium]|nr:hypothetical protein [Campylobacterales bacterium]
MFKVKILQEIEFSENRIGRLVGSESDKLCSAEILTTDGITRAFGFTLDEAINKAFEKFEKVA